MTIEDGISNIPDPLHNSDIEARLEAYEKTMLEQLAKFKQDMFATYAATEEGKERLGQMKQKTPGAYDKAKKYCDESRRKRVHIYKRVMEQLQGERDGQTPELQPDTIPARVEGQTIIATVGGRDVPTSLGEIIADGVMRQRKYALTKPGKHQRQLNIISLVLPALGEMIEIAKQEEIFIESWMPDNASYSQRADIFDLIGNPDEAKRGGVIAEKVVTGFLMRILYDNRDLGFDCMQASPADDVRNKVDFFLVHRAADGKKETTGIQITTNLNDESIGRKLKQLAVVRERIKTGEIEHFNQIELVVLPFNGFPKLVSFWNKNHPDYPGGPERYLDLDNRKDIFTTIFSAAVGPERAEEMWEKIKEGELQHLARVTNIDLAR